MSKTSASLRRGGLYARLAVFALLASGLLLAGGSPAAAASTININPGHVPTTAASFTQNCDFHGGAYPDEDGWAFELPGAPDISGVFQTITTTFRTPTGATTRTIPTAPNSAIVRGPGTSKAWIRVPAGWTLTGASAVVSGTADSFVLRSTCMASSAPGRTRSCT